MTPVDIARRTRAIGAPANWDPTKDGTCGVLCVRDGVEGRYPVMTSAWLPDENEIRLMQQGVPLTLRIYGTVHPVVSLAMGEPDDIAA